VVLYVFGFSAWWWSVVCLRQVVKSYRRLADRLSMQVETKTGEEEGLPYLLARITGFALLICGSMGLEFLRMHTLSLPLPLAPGGVLGNVIGSAAYSAMGFTGATLVLLMAMALGISLYFQVSWLTIAEKTGAAIETVFVFIQNKYAAAEDRRVGQTAAVKREEVVVQERAKIVEASPIRIEPQVVAVQRSERVEKEKQVSLFNELPDTNLPPLSLLDDAPPVQETVSVQTLEFTSRLIEKNSPISVSMPRSLPLIRGLSLPVTKLSQRPA
jgi:S-DNA-T family DNA segregation ATPase FtsK/SpoIIIE